ncbi:MAG TPA: TonB-dependent receptor [Frateuria sp.]|uniref:TonB-dependent receptor n=1 Tax=Frateuria sp. TaxID=2211372 RepID=UPI002D7FBD26|nr:TonB-dependent receptor [Frateuria sp.]HET6806605.1 TonB-dependent receptor [Frateuria sp.]
MTSTHKLRLKRSALAMAMGLCISGGAIAQSTMGSVFGTVDSGASVQVQNLSNGATRATVADDSGRFAFGNLVPGTYRVTVTENGASNARDLTVVAGQGSNFNLVSAAGRNAQSLGTIQVTANTLPAIDISSVEATTVFTAEQLKRLPVARNETAVALLAPGVSSADQSLGNIAVFNGASAAENSYYVNGFPVTNQFQSLTYSEVPFEAVDQEEVKSGGYGAKYGYATGGVISVVTKRGTNEWKGGARVDWVPNALRGHDPAVYLNSGVLQYGNDQYDKTQKTYAGWFGGPLIKDRLFIYGLYQETRTDTQSYGTWVPGGESVSAKANTRNYKNPYWLVKLDWNINDSNILEYTGFNDTENQKENIYYASFGDFDGQRGDYQGSVYSKSGGQTHILKYTGYLTDDFTLSAQYGRLKYSRDQFAIRSDGAYFQYDGNPLNLDQPGCPDIVDARTPALNGEVAPLSGCSFAGGLDKRGGGDERKEGRVDLEWVLGDHDLAAGYVDDRWTSDTGSQGYEGGVLWEYVGDTTNPADGYVIGYYFNTGAQVDVRQKSYYLQDTWHISNNFLAYLGVRNDSFKNLNGDGEPFVKQNNIWQPRVGFSWDVNGDSSFKVYGSAGLYSLPIAATVALRGASASLYRYDVYSYTGVRDDGTDAPVLDQLLLSGVVNGESGLTPPAGAVADKSLSPIKQQEFILGVDKKLSENWTAGVRYIHRDLKNTIDDFCNWTPFYNYAVAHGLDGADPSAPPETMPGCWIVNPGHAADFSIDVNGDGTLDEVHLSKEELGLPEAKRKYDGVEFSLEKQWADHWYFKASYVWAHNHGNTEGLVKSDFNNAQSDTGVTQDFDFPELMIGANGNLPNDRRHTFKVYGAWEPASEWTLSGNLLVQSGRPENCLGVNPAAYSQQGGVSSYLGGSSFFACNGQVVPRGSVGNEPWLWNLDIGAQYRPDWMKGLTFGLDIMNVFNRHTVVKRDERGEYARKVGQGVPGANYDPNDPNQQYVKFTRYGSTFGIPRDFQPPRYVRITAEYDFSL